MEADKLHPALIIGVPVGFVNVVESKERIIEAAAAPYIVARGRKGGATWRPSAMPCLTRSGGRS